MNKSEETNKLINSYKNSSCILHANENALFDISKSLAIIADKLTEENKAVTDFEGYSTRLWNKAYDRGWKEVLEKIRAEIAIPTYSSTIEGYDEGWDDAVSRDLKIIDKYISEREDKT